MHPREMLKNGKTIDSERGLTELQTIEPNNFPEIE